MVLPCFSPHRRAPGVLGATVILSLSGLLAGCGASDEGRESPPPSIAPRQFDGDYRVASLHVPDQPQDLPAAATVTLDTVDGRLVVQAGCNTYFGSFTIEADEAAGGASFTVPGGTDTPCPDDVAAQEKALLGALSNVTFWRARPIGLELSSPDGALLVLEP